MSALNSERVRSIQKYFEAFAARDLAGIQSMLAEDVTLQDPVVKLLRGTTAVVEAYRGIFEAHRSIEAEVVRTYAASADTWAAEFALVLHPHEGEPLRIDGVDCITFRGDKIVSLRAYLDVHERRS